MALTTRQRQVLIEEAESRGVPDPERYVKNLAEKGRTISQIRHAIELASTNTPQPNNEERIEQAKRQQAQRRAGRTTEGTRGGGDGLEQLRSAVNTASNVDEALQNIGAASMVVSGRIPDWMGQVAPEAVAQPGFLDRLRAAAEFELGQSFGDDASLMRALQAPSAENQFILTLASDNVDEWVEISGPLQGTKPLRMRKEWWDSATKEFNNPLVARSTVRAAQVAGLLETTGKSVDVGWQPLFSIFRLQGLAQSDSVQRSASDQANIERDALRAGSRGGSARLAYQQRAQATDEQNLLRRGGGYRLAQQYAQDVKTYGGNSALAVIAAKDRTLADRMFKNGGRPTSQDDLLAAGQILTTAKFDPTTMGNMGFYVDQTQFSNLLQLVNVRGGGGGGSTVSVRLPDEDKVNRSVTELWRAWFQREPTKEEMQAFSGTLFDLFRSEGKKIASGEHSEVDVAAKLKAAAMQNPDYELLFGKKQAGVSEDDYVNQFRAAAANMTGSAVADPAAIRQGQITGDMQTTIGVIAGSENVKRNSTFQQRLAIAAQQVAEAT